LRKSGCFFAHSRISDACRVCLQLVHTVLQCVAVCCSISLHTREYLMPLILAHDSCTLCCSVLQCVAVCEKCIAVCCSVLQCATLCCIVSLYTREYPTSIICVHDSCMLRYSGLQCVVVCSNVLQCIAVCCSVLQCVAVCRCTLENTQRLSCVFTTHASFVAMCRSLLQCVAVCCNVLQCVSLQTRKYPTPVVCVHD